ncbi:MAG: hypothetical protein ACI4TG_07835 [Ruminococcus sp.]
MSRRNRGQSATAKGNPSAKRNPLDHSHLRRADCLIERKYVLRETLSEPSGEYASLFACDRCPPLFYTPICNLTTLNFCISCRFVFSEGEQRYLVSHPATCFNSFALQGWQLAPLFRGCPSPLSATPTFPHTVGNHPRRAEPARPQSPTACSGFPPLRASKRSIYFIRERWVDCQRRLAASQKGGMNPHA